MFCFEVGCLKTQELFSLPFGVAKDRSILKISHLHSFALSNSTLPPLKRDNEALLARLKTSCVCFVNTLHKQGRKKSSPAIPTTRVFCSVTAE